MQYGHANIPYILQPDNIPHAGKSLIVHINATFIIKFYFFDMLYVNTPSFHNGFNSSINGYKYTSIFSFGFFGPRIIKVKNMYGVVMHNSGGKL